MSDKPLGNEPVLFSLRLNSMVLMAASDNRQGVEDWDFGCGR
jgi:hypothetical protein